MDEDITDPERDDGANESAESEAKGGISADLIRGHINTIILRTLYERDKYGYEIIEEIEAKSHGQYTLKQPTLYSALKRLESQGYINAYWKTDEVSQGGRRKYYTLTDSGREVTERNQAEWEYSRTVIDNLISDRNFDFTQPPPSAVDFRILKNSTSRVPSKSDEDESREGTYDEPADEQVVEIEREPATGVIITQSEPEAEAETEETEEPTETTEPTAEAEPEEAPAAAEEPAESAPEFDEERHRNYMRLISEPVEPQPEVPETPYADSFDTGRLIYNNRPETERDYKNLINNLYVKTLHRDGSTESAQPVEAARPRPVEAERTVSTVRIEETPRYVQDNGVAVTAVDYAIGPGKKRYNLGGTMLKCSLIVAVIMLLEFALCLIFKDELGVTLAYPFVIFALTCAQALIFTVLYFIGVGKSVRKPTTLVYLSACLIVTIIIVLIVLVTSLLMNIDFSSAGDIMAKIVIPCIIALNIPIFGVLFYLFSK